MEGRGVDTSYSDLILYKTVAEKADWITIGAESTLVAMGKGFVTVIYRLSAVVHFKSFHDRTGDSS